jgi:hypothetical protein
MQQCAHVRVCDNSSPYYQFFDVFVALCAVIKEYSYTSCSGAGKLYSDLSSSELCCV